MQSGMPKKQDTRVKIPTSKLKWKEVKELETIERDILLAEAEVKRIEDIFSAADFYENHGNRTDELTEELTAAKEAVERLYARWHELEELKSKAGGS